jgi:hypothetical protein
MNILLIILGSIAGLFLLILLIALVVKKAYGVQRSIVIGQPKHVVYDYLRHLLNQEKYSKWFMLDPNMKKTLTGTDGEVGVVYAWDGDKRAGAGEQTITQLVPNERIAIEVRFIRPFAGIAQTPFSVESAGENQTKVTWGMSSAMKYPMNFLLLFMDMDKLLGKQLEASLVNLKNELENKPGRHVET